MSDLYVVCSYLFVSTGLPLPIKKDLFRKIGRLSEGAALAIKTQVLERKVSLKEAVEHCLQVQEREKTLTCAAELLGNCTTAEVLASWGEVFTDKVLDSFAGANRNGNRRGKDLEEFCEKLLLSNEDNLQPKVTIEDIERKTITIGKIDTVVMTIDEMGEEDTIGFLKNALKAIKEKNEEFNIIIEFSSENKDEDIMKIKKFLEEETEKPVTRVFFRKKKGKVTGDY